MVVVNFEGREKNINGQNPINSLDGEVCYIQYQLMEYKVNNSLLSQGTHIAPDHLMSNIFQNTAPPLQAHLNHLYCLISNLYQEQHRTQRQLKAMKDQLTNIRILGQIYQQQKAQQEESAIKKEDGGQGAIKTKKKFIKEFKCELPFCARKYGSVTALRAHMRTKHLTNDDNLDFVPL